MAIDLSKVKDRLKNLKRKSSKSQYLWKPQPGNSTIRLVPYKFNKDFPFIELFFHYDFPGPNYLSPKSFGNPDPIYEFAQHIRNVPGQDNYELFKKLNPKRRTFAPVVVRGEEDQGVKFWGFGKTIYEQLLQTFADPDYGDLSDPKEGRDIKIEYIPGKQTSTGYPETKLMVRPVRTPLTEDKDTLQKIWESQVEITEVYEEPTYEELERALKSYLNGTDPASKFGMNDNNDSSETEDAFDDDDDGSDPMEEFESMFGDG